jgi:hypothetical protein
MNIYRLIGDRIGTAEARELAERLVLWHDAMVKHLRVSAAPTAAACDDDCPHVEAASLWADAADVFGPAARELRFLFDHGTRPFSANAPERAGLRA